jgi:hypothetical protein
MSWANVVLASDASTTVMRDEINILAKDQGISELESAGRGLARILSMRSKRKGGGSEKRRANQ